MKTGCKWTFSSEKLGELKSEGVTPKFIYTIPSPQNPDGSIMPSDRRAKMLAPRPTNTTR